jgi:hypothetical protein
MRPAERNILTGENTMLADASSKNIQAGKNARASPPTAASPSFSAAQTFVTAPKELQPAAQTFLSVAQDLQPVAQTFLSVPNSFIEHRSLRRGIRKGDVLPSAALTPAPSCVPAHSASAQTKSPTTALPGPLPPQCAPRHSGG